MQLTKRKSDVALARDPNEAKKPKVIDLTDSADEDEDEDEDNNGELEEEETVDEDRIDMSVITKLKKGSNTALGLMRYLQSLQPSEVQSLLVLTAFPSTALKLESHCIYCHTNFLPHTNTPDSTSCKIPHFLCCYDDDDGDRAIKVYSCCRTRFDYTSFARDGPECSQSPSELFGHKYCYEGPHRAHEVETPRGGNTDGHWWVELKSGYNVLDCQDQGCDFGGVVTPREKSSREREAEYKMLEEEWQRRNKEVVAYNGSV